MSDIFDLIEKTAKKIPKILEWSLWGSVVAFCVIAFLAFSCGRAFAFPEVTARDRFELKDNPTETVELINSARGITLVRRERSVDLNIGQERKIEIGLADARPEPIEAFAIDNGVSVQTTVPSSVRSVRFLFAPTGLELVDPQGEWLDANGNRYVLRRDLLRVYDELGNDYEFVTSNVGQDGVFTMTVLGDIKGDSLTFDPTVVLQTVWTATSLAWVSDSMFVTHNTDFRIYLNYFDGASIHVIDSAPVGTSNNGPPEKSVSVCGDSAFVGARRTGSPGYGYFYSIRLSNLGSQFSYFSPTDRTVYNVSECIPFGDYFYVYAGVAASAGAILSVSDSATTLHTLDGDGSIWKNSSTCSADDSGGFYFDANASGFYDFGYKAAFATEGYTQADILYQPLQKKTVIRRVDKAVFGDSGTWMMVSTDSGVTMFCAPPNWTSYNRANVEHFHLASTSEIQLYAGNTYFSDSMGGADKCVQVGDTVIISIRGTGRLVGFNVMTREFSVYDTYTVGIGGPQGNILDIAKRETTGGTTILAIASAGGALEFLVFDTGSGEAPPDTVSFDGPFTFSIDEDETGETTLIASTSGGADYSFNVIAGTAMICTATIAGTNVLQCTGLPDQFGIQPFTLQVTFGSASDSAIVYVTVNAVNDSPWIDPDPMGTFIGWEDSGTAEYDISAWFHDTDVIGAPGSWDGIEVTITDPAETSPAVVSISRPVQVAVILNVSSKPDAFGTDTFTVTITDSEGASYSSLIQIDIIGTNDSPVLSPVPNIHMDTNTEDSIVLSPYVTHADDSAVTWIITNDSGYAYFTATLGGTDVLYIIAGDTPVTAGEITVSVGDGDAGDTVSQVVRVWIAPPSPVAEEKRRIIGPVNIRGVTINGIIVREAEQW